MTSFLTIYDSFFGKTTEDMYVVWTLEDTQRDLVNIFKDSISRFEFPRFSLYDYDLEAQQYNCDLTPEEIDIIGVLMVITWLNRQIASVENTRMKYSGDDFKFTSQANHLDKLISLKENFLLESKHLQRLYKRRKVDEKGSVKSNWSVLREVGVFID